MRILLLNFINKFPNNHTQNRTQKTIRKILLNIICIAFLFRVLRHLILQIFLTRKNCPVSKKISFKIILYPTFLLRISHTLLPESTSLPHFQRLLRWSLSFVTNKKNTQQPWDSSNNTVDLKYPTARVHVASLS